MNLPTTATDVWTLATEEDKLKALAAFNSLPARATQSVELVEASYFVALEGVTKYGLAKAVKAILQNALGHAFFPSPPELRGQCDKAMEPHEEMRERIRQREANRYPEGGRREPMTAEKRARAMELVAKLNRTFDAGKDAEIEAERAEIRARYGMTAEALASIKDQPLAGQRLGKQAAE